MIEDQDLQTTEQEVEVETLSEPDVAVEVPQPEEPVGKEYFEKKYKETTEPKEPSPYNRKRGEGYDQVDFKTASPDEIEKRFGRLYAQTKAIEKAKRELEARVKVLSDFAEEEMRAKLSLADEAKKKELKVKISDLQLRGRFEEATEAMEEYLSLKKDAEDKPIFEERFKQTYEDYKSPEEKALDSIPESEKEAVVNFFTNNPYVKDEKVREAAKQRGLVLKQQYPNATPSQIVNQLSIELDQWARNQRTNINTNSGANTAPSAVLSGSPTTQSGPTRITLTPEEQKVAVRTFPELTPQNAIKKYAASKARI